MSEFKINKRARLERTVNGAVIVTVYAGEFGETFIRERAISPVQARRVSRLLQTAYYGDAPVGKPIPYGLTLFQDTQFVTGAQYRRRFCVNGENFTRRIIFRGPEQFRI